ncbi:septum formation initiator family protein [Mucilaginibacter sp. AW1-3]
MKRLIALVKNKYFLITLAFVVWMVFFDANDLYSQYQSYKDVKALQQERDYCLKQTQQVTKDLDELTTNPEKLEKFAREKYLMKKDNEDVFVIVREKKVDQK